MSGTDFRVASVDLAGTPGVPDGAADLVTVNGSAGADNVDLETEGAVVVADGLQTEVRVSKAASWRTRSRSARSTATTTSTSTGRSSP